MMYRFETGNRCSYPGYSGQSLTSNLTGNSYRASLNVYPRLYLHRLYAIYYIKGW